MFSSRTSSKSTACRRRLSGSVFRNSRNNNENLILAYKLTADMEAWLKEAKAFGDHGKVTQCFGLEQLRLVLPENVTYWVQDGPDVTVDSGEGS